MTSAISWNDTSKRIYETGIDRGVLYPKIGPAVPWIGLMSVDENGADATTVYYIDGRPYLHLPQPKEFTATIKAHTYPDEFNKMMGIVEAADGMYLDSQQSDSFDLSYRTLIGDGLKGTAFGYKIHLIYNATVAPQNLSYQTATNTVNTTDMSWNIQAVPIPVTGYRATAHVIIDTRHIDPANLAAIEALIYGDGTTGAAMPNPQTVFDILTFGDTIIITDNGDGTWEAQGSYHNIFMVGDGVFEIDNVNAVDHGDGTFSVSTTP